MVSLYVGSENGTYYGKGTLVYQVGASGVSPIEIRDGVYLDTAGTASLAHLEVTAAAAALPAADILLVQVTGANALNGTFDAFNGGPAEEGTEIVLSGNQYELTYQYAAEAGVMNDIALVYKGASGNQARNPVPVNDAQLDAVPAMLAWTNPEPAIAGNPVFCDVYLGIVSDRSSMDKVTRGNNLAQVDINTANFPTCGNLQNHTRYYWAVDAHDGETDHAGIMWSFRVDYNLPPVVDGGPDQVTWLGRSGAAGQEMIILNGTTSDDGPYTVLWTQEANGAPAVVIIPGNVDDTTVTVRARGVYAFILTADDGGTPISDKVQIIAGDNSCDASHMSTGAAYDEMDQNRDCVVDLADFAALADYWLDCTDRLTGCK